VLLQIQIVSARDGSPTRANASTGAMPAYARSER